MNDLEKHQFNELIAALIIFAALTIYYFFLQ